jgi:hypothetical protein
MSFFLEVSLFSSSLPCSACRFSRDTAHCHSGQNIKYNWMVRRDAAKACVSNLWIKRLLQKFKRHNNNNNNNNNNNIFFYGVHSLKAWDSQNVVWLNSETT